MSEPFLGEITITGFGFAPRGWAHCIGQILPIQQNVALFALLGTTYGGNGTTNFALPDFRGRMPVGVGNSFSQGQAAGTTTETLLITQIPVHSHPITGASAPVGDQRTPAGNLPGVPTPAIYTAPNASMSTTTMSTVGGSQAHNNLQPYLVLNFIIALQGIFPPRN